MIVKKPWGTYEVLLDEPNYKVKRIVVNPYERFSLQYHKHREEHWVVVEGDGSWIATNHSQRSEKLVMIEPTEKSWMSHAPSYHCSSLSPDK